MSGLWIVAALLSVLILCVLMGDRPVVRYGLLHWRALQMGLKPMDEARANAVVLPFGFELLSAFANVRLSRVYHGSLEGLPVTFFEVNVNEKSGGKTLHRSYACAVTRIDRGLPSLRIRPAAAVPGYRHLHFGSSAFAKLYSVKSRSSRLVGRMVNAELVDLFLNVPGLIMEMSHGGLMVAVQGPLHPAMLRSHLARLQRLYAMIPEDRNSIGPSGFGSLESAEQPGAGHLPLIANRAPVKVQGFADFLVGQSAEETQFYDQGLAGVEAS